MVAIRDVNNVSLQQDGATSHTASETVAPINIPGRFILSGFILLHVVVCEITLNVP